MGSKKPALAGGITRAWLAGHQAPAAVRPAGQTLHTVTETISRKGGIFLAYDLLVGVAGAREDTLTLPSSASCVDPDCNSDELIYQVPDGVYEAIDTDYFMTGGQFQYVDASDPQVTVAGDTSVSIDADKAVKVSISTPRPSTSYVGVYTDYRTTADDGLFGVSVDTTTYALANYWAVPSTGRVTVGSYHYQSQWTLGAPPVTMSVTGNGGRQLDPMYADYSATTNSSTPSFLRFSGQHVYPLVYAGHGTAADFAGVDARGKLALDHRPVRRLQDLRLPARRRQAGRRCRHPHRPARSRTA